MPRNRRPSVLRRLAALAVRPFRDLRVASRQGWNFLFRCISANRHQAQTTGAWTGSLCFHASLLVVLALSVVPRESLVVWTLVMMPTLDRGEDDDVVEFPPAIEPVTLPESQVPIDSPVAMVPDLPILSPRNLTDVESPEETAPRESERRGEKPLIRPFVHDDWDASKQPLGNSDGNRRLVVNGLQQALDILTSELTKLLEAHDELVVVWCLDQSESMKDEYAPIRDRIGRIYSELAMLGHVEAERILTAVVAFGSDYHNDMRRPTADVEQVSAAISSIEFDRTGVENFCSATLNAIRDFSPFTRGRSRKLVLILVTDESGDRRDISAHLEDAIAEARRKRCTVFVLGREAAFGDEHATVNWRHPDTGVNVGIGIDRGPDTVLPEQLRYDGFGGTFVVFPSGYGPYAQSRLVAQTGGMFFLLPDVETDLRRGDARVFGVNWMNEYGPELVSRNEYLDRVNRSPLRRTIIEVVSALDPHNELRQDAFELTVQFTRQDPIDAMRKEMLRARQWQQRIGSGVQGLEAVRASRESEPNRRWIANFDLMYAQLHAYQIRLDQYTRCLTDFVNNQYARLPPPKQAPNEFFEALGVIPSKSAAWGWSPDLDVQVKRAEALLRSVWERHPETPWADRARRELKRGFGFKVSAVYSAIHRGVPTRNDPPRL